MVQTVDAFPPFPSETFNVILYSPGNSGAVQTAVSELPSIVPPSALQL